MSDGACDVAWGIFAGLTGTCCVIVLVLATLIGICCFMDYLGY